MSRVGHFDATAIASVLFVSGATPDRFAKALATSADLVVIDLEDAVPADGKPAARAAAIATFGPQRLAVRINGVATRAGVEDLLALADAGVRPACLFVPMVESADELRIVRALLGDAALVPLIETPRGLRQALSIARAPGVAAMMFGGGDLSAALGVALAWEPLAAARAAFVMACAEADTLAIDVPFVALDDSAGLAEDCARAAAIGFQAKAAIHPAQLAAIDAAFRPSADLVAEAEAACAAFRRAGGGAVRFNGRMLEAPIMRRYERILAKVKRTDDA
jgi:citrate lyase beta subunit